MDKKRCFAQPRKQHSVAGLGTILVIGIVAACTAGPGGEQESFFIQGPDGGDCAKIGGKWTTSGVPTCVMSFLELRPNSSLTIRRGASLVVETQFRNDGNIFIRAGDPSGSAFLYLGHQDGPVFAGAGVNNGIIQIIPVEGIGSPGFSNRFELNNLGQIHNLVDGDISKGGLGGIFNNFFNIFNSGNIVNFGFFHNSGPPVQTSRALVDNRGPAGVMRNESGILENAGVIRGRFIGNCSGICEE